MANSYSTADILKGTLQRVGERTDGSSPYQPLALKYVNRAYSDLLQGGSIFAPEVRECWIWAKQTGSFKILPNYQAGSVTLTQDSLNGTFGTAPSISLAGYNFTVIGNSSQQTTSYYTISTHTAASTAFTLDFPYVEASGVYSFNAIPLTVNLNIGILRLADPLRQYNTRVLDLGESVTDMGRIYYVDINKFWELYPLELLRGDIPSKFTIESYSDSNMVLRFNKYPASAIRVDFDYISTQPLLTDSSASVPLVPFENRDVLEIMAAYYLFLDKKQPIDAQNYRELASTRILSMKMNNQGQQKLGKTFGQLIPRLDDTAIPYWLIMQR